MELTNIVKQRNSKWREMAIFVSNDKHTELIWSTMFVVLRLLFTLSFFSLILDCLGFFSIDLVWLSFGLFTIFFVSFAIKCAVNFTMNCFDNCLFVVGSRILYLKNLPFFCSKCHFGVAMKTD